MRQSKEDSEFDLERFLPYLLNQAAEATSRSFQAIYKDAYGMTRTQWRVMANLGKFGATTARNICVITHEEKTKVSRAISALEAERLVKRTPSDEDGRSEVLSLTSKGKSIYAELGQQALHYERKLRGQLGRSESAQLQRLLKSLIESPQ